MKKMLYRAGYDGEIIDMVKDVVQWCRECSTWRRTMTKPQVKASISEHFNFRVQTDLLFVFDFDVEGVGQLDGRTFAGVDGPAKDFAAMDILQVDGEPFCSGDMQFLFRMIEWQFDFV